MAYEINININGDFEEQTTTPGVSQTNGTSTSDATAKGQKALGKYVASQTITPFIQEVKTQITQNVGLVTGNTELQNRINLGFQAVQFGVNTYKNAQAGAVIAQSAGIGGGVGAAIGIALTAISTGLQIAFNQMQINLQARMENYQLEQVRSRAGIAYNKSRSGA